MTEQSPEGALPSAEWFPNASPLLVRIERALQRHLDGHSARRLPVDDSDSDVVLEDVRAARARGLLASSLLAGAPETDEQKSGEDFWIDLAERHAIRDWSNHRPNGYISAVKALCADFAAATSPAPGEQESEQ